MMSVDVYADNTVTTRIPPQLIKSDIAGKGAAQIGWGSPGDFDRCLAFARRHGVPKHMQKGFCANLHKLATGEWPGVNAHKGAHALMLDWIVASAAPAIDAMIRWEGPLAVVGEPTGDRRRFPHDTLKYQSFPQPFRFQRQGLQGHQGAVTVGVIEGAREQMYSGDQPELKGKRVVWGHGYFLDPKIVSEVNEAIHLAEHGVSGPSVDLDSYTAVLKKNALSGETTADMVRGRQRAATLVSVPAFADLRIKVIRPDVALVAAAHPGAWASAPIAPREAMFDADDAAKRIEAWANGDPDKMASMFLWIADSANAPLIGRRGYRLPWGDIIDDKPYLIYHAVYAAAALLQGAHGGLPNIPEEAKGQLRTIITEIYEKLADEFDDASIVAPWDNQTQQASGPPDPDEESPEDDDEDDDFRETEEYQAYLVSFDAALEEFRGRYTESKHPRDKRKNDHAGEWIDNPKTDAHGRIKVGSKWVYPPKRGEKGWRNPQAAVRAKAKRGAGSPAKRSSGTRVVKKARVAEPQRPVAVKKVKDTDDHLARLRTLNRQRQKRYLGGLSDEEINKIKGKVGGSHLDDDTRDDTETEIIRQLGKGDGEEETARRKDEQTKERDRQVREIAHEGGKKTVIAKKKEPEKKEPEKKEPQDRVAKLEGELDTLKGKLGLAEDKRRRNKGGRVASQEETRLRGQISSKQRELEAARRERDGTKEPEKKAPVKKAVAKKVTPEKKAPETGGDDSDVEELKQRRKELKQNEAMLAESSSKGLAETKRHKELLDERKQLQQDIDELETKVGKAPEKKVPEKKASGLERLMGGKLTDEEKEAGRKQTQERSKEPEKKTTVVRKTTGAAKEHKVTPAQQKALEKLRDMGTQAKIHPATRKVLEREGYLNVQGNLTEKGRKHVGGKEEKTPEKKAPEKETAEAGAQRIAGELSKAKSREEMESIVADLRGPLLREVEANTGVPSRGTLAERRKRIVDGAMVRLTGRSGETKAPEKKTIVGKKVARKSTEEHVKALDGLESREAADEYLAEQKLTNAELRNIATAQGKKPTSNMTKAQLTELVGRGARMKGYKKAVETTFKGPGKKHTDSDVETAVRARVADLTKGRDDTKSHYVDIADVREELDKAGIPRDQQDKVLRAMANKEDVSIIPAADTKNITQRDRDAALKIGVEDNHFIEIGGNERRQRKNARIAEQEKKEPERKTTVAKKTPAERDKERVDEALKKYRALTDETGVDKVLAGLQRRHLEQIARAEGLNVQKAETGDSLRVWLWSAKKHQAQSEKARRDYTERIAQIEAAKKQREADYAARASGAKAFEPDNRSPRPWWTQVTEDTGPEGVHAVDVDVTPGAPNRYVMSSGTLYRRNGVSYLVEDGDDMLAPSDVAEQFDKFHASLPEDLRHHQQAYVWVRGENPADSYWAQHYQMPGFMSLATAGDGSVRVWSRGNDTRGPQSHAETLRHEFGHSVSYGIGREHSRRTGEASTPLHDTPQWRDAAERDPELRKVKASDVVVARQHEGGPEDAFKLTRGDSKKKGFPLGVTDYGQNSPSEDFAESVAMYTHEGPVGFVTRDGKRVPVYFRDLFPARARLLDGLLPQVAARQRKLIEQRGPL